MQPFADDPTSTTPEDVTDVFTSLSAPPQREGLPRGFRMRADAHYVDQLDTADPMTIRFLPVDGVDGGDAGGAPDALVDSIRRYGVLQPLMVQDRGGRRPYLVIAGKRRLAAARAAGLQRVPCVVHTIEDALAAELSSDREPAAHAGAEPAVSSRPGESAHMAMTERDIEDALQGVLASARFLASRSARTRELAALALTADAERALTLFMAIRVLREQQVISKQPLTVQRLAAALAQRKPGTAGADRAIVDMEQVAAGQVVWGSEEMLVAAVSGAALAFSLLTDQGPTADARVRVSQRGRDVTLAVHQEGLEVPQGWLQTAFDEPWPIQHGAAVSVLMRMVEHVARLHGGEAAVTAHPEGTTLTLRLPAEPDRQVAADEQAG